MNCDYYKRQIEKQASLASLAAKALPAIKSFTSSSLGKRVAIGAGVGAAAKGLTYKPENGGSRLGSMINGAVNGGVVGGALSSKNIASAGKTIANKGKALSSNATSKVVGKNPTLLQSAKTNIGDFANEYGNKINSAFK